MAVVIGVFAYVELMKFLINLLPNRSDYVLR